MVRDRISRVVQVLQREPRSLSDADGGLIVRCDSGNNCECRVVRAGPFHDGEHSLCRVAVAPGTGVQAVVQIQDRLTKNGLILCPHKAHKGTAVTELNTRVPEVLGFPVTHPGGQQAGCLIGTDHASAGVVTVRQWVAVNCKHLPDIAHPRTPQAQPRCCQPRLLIHSNSLPVVAACTSDESPSIRHEHAFDCADQIPEPEPSPVSSRARQRDMASQIYSADERPLRVKRRWPTIPPPQPCAALRGGSRRHSRAGSGQGQRDA